MRSYFTLGLFAAAIGMASLGVLGCDDGGGKGGNGGEGGGDGGGTTTTSNTGSTSTGPTTSTTGMTTSSVPVDCTGIAPANDCGACLESQCCSELAQCAADAECDTCTFQGQGDPAVCNANAQVIALFDCLNALCETECSGPPFNAACDVPDTAPSGGSCVTVGNPAGVQCNPITQEPCDTAAGAACDAAQGGFQCFPSGNVKAICESCGANDNDFCQPGMFCTNGVCARYCCDDADCGGMGTCNKIGFAVPEVGVCEAI